MEISEGITYTFNGSFTFAYRTLPVGSGVTYQNFSLREGSFEYARSDTERPGTFMVLRQDDEIVVRWYFKADNETRTFQISYLAESAVHSGGEGAELFYKFVGREWGGAIQQVNLTLTSPEPVEPARVMTWVHAPAHATSKTADDGVLFAACEDFPDKSLLEVRAVYPVTLFPSAPSEDIDIRKRAIRQERERQIRTEEKRREEILAETARRERWKRGKWILSLITAACLYVIIMLYRRYGTRPPVHFNNKVIRYIPEKIKPPNTITVKINFFIITLF